MAIKEVTATAEIIAETVPRPSHPMMQNHRSHPAEVEVLHLSQAMHPSDSRLQIKGWNM